MFAAKPIDIILGAMTQAYFAHVLLTTASMTRTRFIVSLDVWSGRGREPRAPARCTDALI